MHYGQQGRRYNRESTVMTPWVLSQWIHDIISPVLKPQVILDPCIGSGRLVEPWFEEARIIGVDLENQPNIAVDWFFQYAFDLFTTWPHAKPDLILCNPPFNGGETQMMWPERFLRTMVSLFGREQPIVMICPHGFRLNLRTSSKRYLWMREEGPKITSIVSLPLDVFPQVKFHSEMLIFNIPGLEPHYWYGTD